MFLWQIFEAFRNWYYGTKPEDKKTESGGCPMSASKDASNNKVEDAAPKSVEAKAEVGESNKSTETDKTTGTTVAAK